MSRAWRWTLAWAVFIEGLILWPSPPDVPSPFTLVGIDKLVHAALFAVQGALAAWALRRDGRPWWPALAGVVLFAAFTELEQHFIPTRSMELADFVADAIGTVIGLVAFALWAPKRQELHR